MANYSVKVLVVEDEMIIGAKVSMYLAELGYEVAGIYARAEETLHFLKENEADIALVDIQLKGNMDGIELAYILREKYNLLVLFLTANYDDATFARAKDAKPYAFLSKPLNKLDLKRALELAVSHSNNGLKHQETEALPEQITVLSDRIFVHHGHKKVKVLFDEMLYIQAERNYCRIVTNSREFVLSIPMKTLEESLPSLQFQRIHRSYIVNIKQVDEINDHAVFVAGKMLALSKSYQHSFLQRIKSI
jgi:DNA-binding LytR/AlgR family response regulator